MPPKTANTLHKHVRAEEFVFVLEGVGKIRIDGTTLTLPKHASVWVRPHRLRQIFNDSDKEVRLIVGAPKREFGPNEAFDLKLFWPVDPKQLPQELNGVSWPPRMDGVS